MEFDDSSISLEVLLRELPAGLVRRLGAPVGPDTRVRAVGLADPDTPDRALAADTIVLGVGCTGRAATTLLRTAARDGAAAVALRSPAPTAARRLAGVAAEAGVALLDLARTTAWGELHAQLLSRLEAAGSLVGDDTLVGLAQTTAALTEGLVTIEDTRSRVLAYSTSDDAVDELRRLSILGRSGPPAYLALLREWGVYERLTRPNEVVEIAEHPESGIRRRLAVGIFAGDVPLGTIWVQQGSRPFPARAREALLGAARLAAPILVGGEPGDERRRQDELVQLLDGRATTLDGLSRRAANRPCLVVAFGFEDADRDPGLERQRLRDAARVVGLQSAALRAGTRHAVLGGRVYVLLPDVADPAAAVPTVRATVTALRRHLDRSARAAVGPVVETVAAAVASRRGADLALSRPGPAAVRFDTVRPALLVDAALETVRHRAELLDPRLAALTDSDAATLAGYLASGSDVAATAERLGVHPTTVRYRLRRLADRDGLDLTDPDVRLASELQLRATARMNTPPGRP